MLQDLQRRTKSGHEIFEDHGFEEQDFRETKEQEQQQQQLFCESELVPGSKDIVLYNVVRETFRGLVRMCVLEKYGLVKS